MLYYDIPWPLMVIAPDAALAQYQAFFKHLFDLKWVERELNETCRLYQTTKSLANTERRTIRQMSIGGTYEETLPEAETVATRNLMLAYQTCQSMTHFFRQYLLYSSFELLDPLWKSLEQDLHDSFTVDDMISHHLRFLEKVTKGLFLSRKIKLPPALFKVAELALKFAKLSAEHLQIDYSEVEDIANSYIHRENLKGYKAKIMKRKFKSRRIRAMVNAALTNPQFESDLQYVVHLSVFNTESRISIISLTMCRKVSSEFKEGCKTFLSLLIEAYHDAKKAKQDTRDELECLSNLIQRLNFNGYFSRLGVK